MPWRCASVGIVELTGDAAHLAEALVVGEEERPVAHDRAADHAAELIALERRLLAGRRLEEAGRVQRRVADELPGAAAEPVGAAGVGDVDRRAGRARRTPRSCCW